MALKLTASQEDIVFSTANRILVLAAPGCGKTTTLAYHLANVIKNELTPASKILCLSYSQLSLSAISDYLSRACNEEVKLPNIRSFGSLCYSILERHLGTIHQKLSKDGLTILEENNPYYLDEVKTLLSKHGIDDSKINDFNLFVKNVQNNDYHFISNSVFSREMVDELRNTFFNQNCILLGDFSYLAYTLLSQSAIFDTELRPYRRLYVDEFQDVNFYQSQIIKMMVNRNDCYCFITGNADECVYGFRGASREYLDALKATDSFTIYNNLIENFRSRQGIVDFSQAIERQIDAVQGTSIQRPRIIARFGNSTKPAFLVFKTKELECEYVADSIGRLVHENNVKFGDIAVLAYHGAGGFELGQIKSNLTALGYPCTTYGAKEDEGETQIMSSIFVCLSTFLTNQPSNFLNRITTLMKVSYNQKGFQKIAARLIGKEEIEIEEAIPYLYQHISEIPQKAVASLTNAYKAFSFFEVERKKVLGAKNVSLRTLLMDLEIFLIDRTQTLMDPVLAKAFEHASANLKELEERGEGKSPNEVLASLHDGVSTFKDDDTGVQLMTFTRSKGLQFHFVFLVGLENETFPGESPARYMSELERLRLFYVAATRAKYTLCLTAVAENEESLLSESSASVMRGLGGAIKINGDFGKILSPEGETIHKTSSHVDHQIEVSERLRKDRARTRAIIRYLTSEETDLEEKNAARNLLSLLEEKSKAKTEQIVASEKKTIDWYLERIHSLNKKLDKKSEETIDDFLAIEVNQENADVAFFYRVAIKSLGTLVELLATKSDQFKDDSDSEKVLREFSFRDSCHQFLIPVLRTLNDSSSDSLTGLLNRTGRYDAVFWDKCLHYGIDLDVNKSYRLIEQMKMVSALMDSYYHFRNSPLSQDPNQERFLERNRVLVKEFLNKDANSQRSVLLSCVRFFSKFFKATQSRQLFEDASEVIYPND